MADISNITLPNGSSAKIKDATARTATQWLDKLDGSKNLLSIYTFERASMYADVQSDGCTVRVHGTGSGVDLTYGTFTVPETGEYSALISIKSGTVTSLYLKPDSGDSLDLKNVTTPTSMGSLTQGTVYELKTWTGTGATVDFTVSILICKTGVLESGLIDFRPPALTNASLTTATTETYDRVCSKNLYNWEESYNLDNCYNVKGTYTTQGDTRTNLRFEIRLCNSSNIAIQNITLNQEITTNGTYTWSFFYNGGATNFLIGHSGSKYNGRYRQPVNDLVVGAKYYISINIVQASNSLGAFIWKDVMICTAADWDVSHDYVPYNTLDGTTLPIAVKELSDADGQKNVLQLSLDEMKAKNWDGTWSGNTCTINGIAFTVNSDYTINVTGTLSSGANRALFRIFFDRPNTYGGLFLTGCAQGGGASTWRLVFEQTTSPWSNIGTDNGNGVTLTDNTVNNIYGYIAIYTTSAVNLTFKPMICTKAQWDISHEYQPYALPNSTLTQGVIWNTNNGVKNLLNFDADTMKSVNTGGTWSGNTWSLGNNVTMTINSDKSITLNGTANAGKTIYLVRNLGLAENAYTLSTGALTTKLWAGIVEVGGTENNYTGSTTHIDKTCQPNHITLYVESGCTLSNFTVYPMLTLKSLYDVDTTYQPCALPNTKITPELIELVDSGAKNLWATPNGTVSGWRETFNGVLPKGDYVISFTNLTSTDTDANTCQIIGVKNSSVASNYAQCPRGNNVYTTLSLTSDIDSIWIYSSNSSGSGDGDTATFTGCMICTKAAWDVSHKFVPYRPSYEETVEQVATNRNNISTLSRITIANKRYSASGLSKKWEVDFSEAFEGIYFISIDYNGSISLYAFTYIADNVQNLTAMYVTSGNEVSSVVIDENKKLTITFNEYAMTSRRIATLSSCALW